MKQAVKSRSKGTVPRSRLQSPNPSHMVWEGTTLVEEDSEAWFKHHVADWSKRSGFDECMTAGVFYRWLHFFALFEGNAKADKIKARFSHLAHAC